MNSYHILYLILFGAGLACNNQTSTTNTAPQLSTDSRPTNNISGDDLATRISPPNGYTRISLSANSWGDYLRHLPLKPDGAEVHTYDGRVKPAGEVYCAVVNIDVGKKDLQQCADAVMRLRAEYLWAQKRYTDIHFNLTNGFKMDYDTWSKGNRLVVSGNKTSWKKSAEASSSYASFRKYLDIVFTYAGTLSLSKELKAKKLSALSVGDVFIHGGSPGHAVTVVDVAQNGKGKTVFLLAQSYMPAQDIQILQNPNSKTLSPWYEVEEGERLYTPEWTFEWSDLKSF